MLVTDIPQIIPYSKEACYDFLIKFTELYTYMFGYPKPLIAALNGHTIAGGCMLAIACDQRIMVSGKAKISLNEIGFGSSVFAGSVEMLRFLVGSRYTSAVLVSGAMYSAEEAASMGLVDQITTEDKLITLAESKALEMGNLHDKAL